MASVNLAVILGTLGRDPEYREGSTPIATFSLATNRRYNGKDGNTVEETEWHRIVAFGRTADIVKQYLHKGDSCYVQGRLRTRKYQAKDGTDRYATEIVCDSLQLLPRGKGDSASKSEAADQKPAAKPQSFDDIPF